MSTRPISPRARVARDPTRRLSYVSFVSLYDSLKMGLRFPAESQLEREAMVLLDADRGVRAFHAQPETFTWRCEGRVRRYTPDLLVDYYDEGKIYLEVKPLGRIDAGMDGRRPEIEAACAARDARFGIWGGDRIRGGHRLAGAKRVVAGYSYLVGASGGVLREAVEAAIGRIGLPATLGAIVAASGKGRVAEGAVLGLVATGTLWIDLDTKLGDDSVVEAPGTGGPAPGRSGHREWR